jgi:hypothetical protein
VQFRRTLLLFKDIELIIKLQKSKKRIIFLAPAAK